MKTLLMQSLILVVSSMMLGAGAQNPEPEDRAEATLRAAVAALKGVRSCAYEFEFFGSGGLARVPFVSGRAELERGATRLESRIRMRTELREYRASRGEPRVLEVVSDGSTATGLAHPLSSYHESPMAAGGDEIIESLGGNGLMDPFIDPNPFQIELTRSQLSVVGEEEVEGSPCVVVEVMLPGDPDARRWYIRSSDHLPVRFQTIYQDEEGPSDITLTLRKLQLNVKLDPETLRLAAPEGWKQNHYRSHLPAGAEAPPWELSDTEGRSRRSAAWKGQVQVLLFFSATRDELQPIMPTFQRLHREYAASAAQFAAISMHEKEDALLDLYHRNENLGFPLLVGGDQLAEAHDIGAPPVCVVIGRDHRIAHVAVGIRGINSWELLAAIDRALQPAKEKTEAEKTE